MANSDKNIVITPNIGSSTDDPKVVFTGANTSGSYPITMRAYPTSNGTLSIEGSAGQLFSVTNSMTGTIFSVNDVSGMPSIDVQDTGAVRIAPFGGSVTIGKGCYNTFIGKDSGCSNTTGRDNTFMGHKAGYSNTTGLYNFYAGKYAGQYASNSRHNNYFGLSAGANATGCYNNFFGLAAGNNSTGGDNNFLGRNAGSYTTSGSYNTFIGQCAGRQNTTGGYNHFIGDNAGRFNTTGTYNTFIGSRAGYHNSVGCGNIFLGKAAGYCSGYVDYGMGMVVASKFNTFIGYYAGYNNSSGQYNALIGYKAGYWGSCSGYNVGMGHQIGYNLTGGSRNILLGYRAGCALTGGTDNILIGTYSGVSGGNANGLANITTETGRIILGNTFSTCAQIQVAWTVVSDCRDKLIHGKLKHGRHFLQGIEPIEFTFKDRETGLVREHDNKKRYGFSAQNVLEAEGDENVIVSTDDPDRLQITSDYMVPILVNAVNELSQELDSLKDKLISLGILV